MYEEIERLKREGLSIRAIGELTGYDRKTVRKYLQQGVTQPAATGLPRAGKLDPFKAFLEERLKAGEWNARVLMALLRQRGFDGGYTLLTDWLRPLREAARVTAVLERESPPGQQACADWGRLGRLEIQGRRRQLWCFTLTLAYSRGMSAVVAPDQKLPSILQAHEEAFRSLGGVPRRIRYGPLSAVWLDDGKDGEAQWNPAFLNFARHWEFHPEVDRSHRRQMMRRAPLGVRYVRKNFQPTLTSGAADRWEDLNSSLSAWVAHTANQRVFSAVNCQVDVRLEVERRSLSPLGERPAYPHFRIRNQHDSAPMQEAQQA